MLPTRTAEKSRRQLATGPLQAVFVNYRTGVLLRRYDYFVGVVAAAAVAPVWDLTRFVASVRLIHVLLSTKYCHRSHPAKDIKFVSAVKGVSPRTFGMFCAEAGFVNPIKVRPANKASTKSVLTLKSSL